MAVEFFDTETPTAGAVATIIPASSTHDFFTSVVCANKGLGEAKVTVYGLSSGETELQRMYYCKDQIVPGNTTFETKKLTISGTKALYATSSNGNVCFSSVGLKSERF